MDRPLTDAELAEFSPEQAEDYREHFASLVANVTRGLNAAWAVANVPGTRLTLVRSSIVAFKRDAGHAPVPDRISRYVDAMMAGVAA